MKRSADPFNDSRVSPYPAGGLMMTPRNYGIRKCRLPECGAEFKAITANGYYCKVAHRIKHHNRKTAERRMAANG